MHAARTMSNEATLKAVFDDATPVSDDATGEKGYAMQDAYAPRPRPVSIDAGHVTSNVPMSPSTLGSAAVATAGALTRDWDVPLYLTQGWFHFLSDGLSTTSDIEGAGPLVTAAVMATPLVFPVAFFADAINTLAYPAKIAARFVAQQCLNTSDASRPKAI